MESDHARVRPKSVRVGRERVLHLERAALLLREGKLPISQIAVDVGFAHQSHLAMHMKRLLGTSPSRFHRSAE